MDGLVASLKFDYPELLQAIETELSKLGTKTFERGPTLTEREIARYTRMRGDAKLEDDAGILTSIASKLNELHEVLDWNAALSWPKGGTPPWRISSSGPKSGLEHQTRPRDGSSRKP
jgi:hypothetical protein